MSRLYPDRPWVGVLAAVRRGPRCLLARRGEGADTGKWGFVGGQLELGETVLECAARELAEEAGIDAAPVGVLTTFDYIDRDGDSRVRFHFTLVCVVLEWRAGEGERLEPEHVTGLGWFTPEEVEAARMPTSRNAVALMRRALAFEGA
ncbi:MAG TPA: NUDIX domain-containing protein [Stellaceae bacterium]|nr:NUDIX domain-containing protein [Stellaceae bacterium]